MKYREMKGKWKQKLMQFLCKWSTRYSMHDSEKVLEEKRQEKRDTGNF